MKRDTRETPYIVALVLVTLAQLGLTVWMFLKH
jgi:hypothetical protein